MLSDVGHYTFLPTHYGLAEAKVVPWVNNVDDGWMASGFIFLY